MKSAVTVLVVICFTLFVGKTAFAEDVVLVTCDNQKTEITLETMSLFEADAVALSMRAEKEFPHLVFLNRENQTRSYQCSLNKTGSFHIQIKTYRIGTDRQGRCGMAMTGNFSIRYQEGETNTPLINEVSFLEDCLSGDALKRFSLFARSPSSWDWEKHFIYANGPIFPEVSLENIYFSKPNDVILVDEGK